MRVKADVDGNLLVRPQLSGDFFLMPPEALSSVETFLHGWDLHLLPEDALTNRLQKFLDRERITLSGISAADIARVVTAVGERAGVVPRAEEQQ